MEFYGRDDELMQLKRIHESSGSASRFTVITGRRRIGKTSLVLKSVKGMRHVYLFVSRVSQKMLCEDMQRAVEEEGIEILGRIERFGDLLKALMIRSREESLVLIIDEFQDFKYVDKTIFQDIQNVWDRYKGESRISLVVCGSAHSMMVSIFENDKEPLFGRPTDKIVLNPLPIKVMEKVLEDHDGSYTSQDLLMFYMLTGGVPKYMEVLVDSGAFDSESMLERATSAGSVFLTDGKDLLVTEFGKEYRTYASILQLLSSGKEKRSEIEDVLQTEAGAYLKRMEDELGLVRHVSPVFSEPSSRNIKWKMSDPYLKFYFRFIRPSTGYVESGRYDLLLRSIKAGLPDYEGRALEDFFRRRISEEDTYTEVGGYWNRKGDVEIDIVVVDDIERKVRLIEVKRNQKKLNMKDLESKRAMIRHELEGYDVSYEGLSSEDVRRNARS